MLPLKPPSVLTCPRGKRTTNRWSQGWLSDNGLACTAKRVTRKSPINFQILKLQSKHYQTINLQNNFYCNKQTEEVLKIIKKTSNDCCAGFDNIPVSLIKPVAEYIASPLAHNKNSDFEKKQWKIEKSYNVFNTKNN